MGSETTKALRARREEAAARVDRLIAEAEQVSPTSAARKARINSATREGRRALTAIAAAERALADAEVRTGAALGRLTWDGISRNEAYESLGISRAVGRRLTELFVSTGRAVNDLSTDRFTHPVGDADRGEREICAPNEAISKGIH